MGNYVLTVLINNLSYTTPLYFWLHIIFLYFFPLAVVECDTLPGNYYNTIISAANGTYYGSKAEISCPPGYRLEGPQVLTCLATGQWSSALPRCIRLEPSTPAPTLPPTFASTQPPTPSPAVPSTTSYRPRTTSTSRQQPSYKPTYSTTQASSTTQQQPLDNLGGGERSDFFCIHFRLSLIYLLTHRFRWGGHLRCTRHGTWGIPTATHTSSCFHTKAHEYYTSLLCAHNNDVYNQHDNATYTSIYACGVYHTQHTEYYTQRTSAG